MKHLNPILVVSILVVTMFSPALAQESTVLRGDDRYVQAWSRTAASRGDSSNSR